MHVSKSHGVCVCVSIICVCLCLYLCVSRCICVCVSVCPCLLQVGVLFDVDGVLLRGGSVIPAARRAFQKLVDKNNNFLFPVVFVTNAGSCQRHVKAMQLSHLLDVQVGR